MLTGWRARVGGKTAEYGTGKPGWPLLTARQPQAPRAPVAQLDRALPSEGRGHRFESCRVRQIFQYLKCICRRRLLARVSTKSAPARVSLELLVDRACSFILLCEGLLKYRELRERGTGCRVLAQFLSLLRSQPSRLPFPTAGATGNLGDRIVVPKNR